MGRVERAGSHPVNGRQQACLSGRCRRPPPPPGRAGRQWRPLRAAGIALFLLLVERLLVAEVGSPRSLTETLRDLGEPWAEPVTSVLALLALTAEALAGYLLMVLALRLLGTLPGSIGHGARRLIVATTPGVVRRLVDVLIGSTLLVQVALATPGDPFAHRPVGFHQAVAAASTPGRSGPRAAVGELAPMDLRAAALRCSAASREPVEARPIHRRSAAPLPPWLRGGPSKPPPGLRLDAGEHIVAAGDTLWDIAAAHLMPAERSATRIHRYWQQVYRANRSVVGADPDLIRPGMRLDVVPFGQDR
jgi:LysM domain